IMYNSSVDALPQKYEYVELWNISAQTIDLAGCIFEDVRLPTNAWPVPPGALVVLADAPRTVLNSVYPPIAAERFAQMDIGLADDGETLRFKSPNDVDVHAVTYASGNGWPSAPNGFGPSLELTSALLDDTHAASWAASTGFGTPGYPNSAFATGTQAAIVDVAIVPAQPAAGQPVYLTARVLAAAPILSVTATWRTNALDTNVVALADDGSHGDGSANDSVYGAALPAMPAGMVVWYIIRAELADGTVLESPPNMTPAANAAPLLAVEMWNSTLGVTVTPAAVWQVVTNTGRMNAGSSYGYIDFTLLDIGDCLIDDVRCSDSTTQYIQNVSFDNAAYWYGWGAYAASYIEPRLGFTAPGSGCIVNDGSTYYGSYYTSFNKTTNAVDCTFSFAYRSVPKPDTRTWHFYGVEPDTNPTICISEINYHPMHDGLGNLEFVELYNYGAAPVNLAQWTLENKDGVRFAVTREALVPPGGCLLLCGDAEALAEYYDVPAALCLGPLPFDLGNGNDVLTLRAWDGRIVDAVAYQDHAPWPTRADGAGATLERRDAGAGGASATNWQASTSGGTPGYPNGAWGADILAVWHNPAVPRASDAITIFARVTNIIGGVRVRYQPDESGAWLTQAMTGPDANGLCSAALGTFASGTYIPFYCEYSTAVARIRYPSAGTRQPALLEVDDTRDSYTLPVWRLLFANDNWNKLYSRAWLWDNSDVDATLIIGTQVFYNIGTHFRGNYSRQYQSAHNLYLNYGQTWRGHRKLSLAYNWEDDSRIVVPYAQEMYKRMGVPVFDTSMCIFKRRGQELGLLHYIEPYDEVFMQSNALTSGNLYKAAQADRQQALFTFAGYQPELYQNCYEPHAALDPAHQYADLARGLEALYALPPEVFAAQATNFLDPVSFGREQAMYHFLHNSDGWPQWGQNYLLHGNAGGQMKLYPQDIGAVMVWYGWPVYPTVAGVNRFLRLPDVARIFWGTYTNALARIPAAVQRSYIDTLYNQAKNDMGTSFLADVTTLKNNVNIWYASTGTESPNGIAAWSFVWLSLPNRCVLVNEPYYYRAVAFDTAGRTITYSMTGAPAWLGIDSATGEIRGTPATTGSFSFQARANNGVTTLAQTCTVVVQQPSVRLHLRCDKGSGTTVADASGNGNTGTRQNNVTWAAGGRYSNCLYFGAASTDRLAVNAAASLNIEGDFTFEAWIKFTQKNKPQSLIFEKYEELGFEMGQDGTVMGGRMWYGPFDDGNAIQDGLNGHGYVLMRYNEDANARLMQSGVWHHVAVTHERDRNEVYIYLNNQRIGGLVWNGNLLGTDALRIGGPFDGWMDEMKLCSFARKAFNIGVSIDAVRFAAPRAYVQLSYFNRGAVPPLNLKYFALRVEPAGTWHPLPAVELPPGGTVRIDLADIPGLASLPENGALALYPFEPDTIYPPGNYQHTCTKILDYVAWGDFTAAPTPEHPAVQAGLWQSGGVVSTNAASGRCALRVPGRNDEGVNSWVGGMRDQQPPTVATNTLITPAGGEMLDAGVPFAITWATNAITDEPPVPATPVSLYFRAAGVTNTCIVPWMPNAGVSLWVPPTWAQDRTNCFITLVARDRFGNTAADVNAAPFQVLPEPTWLIFFVSLIVTTRRFSC
ncbi:MAG: lamin tail domain-containing protein, partial [bacterium]|nr:lamin tail domain-containing protein [bacterium]